MYIIFTLRHAHAAHIGIARDLKEAKSLFPRAQVQVLALVESCEDAEVIRTVLTAKLKARRVPLLGEQQLTHHQFVRKVRETGRWNAEKVFK